MRCAVVVTLLLSLMAAGRFSPALDAQAPAAGSKVPNLTGIWNRLGALADRPNKAPVVTARALGFSRAFDEVMMPGYDCSPVTIPVILGDRYNFQITQQNDRVILKYEKEDVVRTVWLDGHNHPKPGPYDFSIHGHSAGRYEGNQLVIETTKFVFDPRGLNDNFIPTTTSKKVVERYWREGDRLKMISVTTDPLILREPFEYSFEWEATKKELEPYGCNPEDSSYGRPYQPSKYQDPDFVRLPSGR
jgi:hypothetical protein